MKKYCCFFLALTIVVFMLILGGCAYDNGVVESQNNNGSINSGETDNPSTSVNNGVMPTPPSVASGEGDLNNGDQPLQPEFSPEPTSEPTPEPTPEPMSEYTSENARELAGITAEDFVLTISVEAPTLRYGAPAYKGFEVYAELKNQSGRDLEIIVGILFWPRIPNWSPSDAVDIAEPITILFPKDSVIRREPTDGRTRGRPLDEPLPIRVGRCGYGSYSDLLPVGTHELRIGAVFYVVCEQGNENQWIGVSSNVVELTILP